MRAASVIDTIQSIVLLAVALFLPLPALIAAGGLAELKIAFATIGPDATDWFGGKSGVAAIAFAAGVVGLGLAMCGQPHALVRFMAAKDEATLRIARWARASCGSRSCSQPSCSAAGAHACSIRDSSIRSSRSR